MSLQNKILKISRRIIPTLALGCSLGFLNGCASDDADLLLMTMGAMAPFNENLSPLEQALWSGIGQAAKADYERQARIDAAKVGKTEVNVNINRESKDSQTSGEYVTEQRTSRTIFVFTHNQTFNDDNENGVIEFNELRGKNKKEYLIGLEGFGIGFRDIDSPGIGRVEMYNGYGDLIWNETFQYKRGQKVFLIGMDEDQTGFIDKTKRLEGEHLLRIFSRRINSRKDELVRELRVKFRDFRGKLLVFSDYVGNLKKEGFILEKFKGVGKRSFNLEKESICIIWGKRNALDRVRVEIISPEGKKIADRYAGDVYCWGYFPNKKESPDTFLRGLIRCGSGTYHIRVVDRKGYVLEDTPLEITAPPLRK